MKEMLLIKIVSQSLINESGKKWVLKSAVLVQSKLDSVKYIEAT